MHVCVNRLQHEVSVLRQQLSESRTLVHALQSDLQAYRGACDVTTNTRSGEDPRHAAAVVQPEIGAWLKAFGSRSIDTATGVLVVLSAFCCSYDEAQRARLQMFGLNTAGTRETR